MKDMYTIEQLDSYLATLPLGTEEVQNISEFCKRQEERLEWCRNKINTAAQIIGHDVINEATMYD